MKPLMKMNLLFFFLKCATLLLAAILQYSTKTAARWAKSLLSFPVSKESCSPSLISEAKADLQEFHKCWYYLMKLEVPPYTDFVERGRGVVQSLAVSSDSRQQKLGILAILFLNGRQGRWCSIANLSGGSRRQLWNLRKSQIIAVKACLFRNLNC